MLAKLWIVPLSEIIKRRNEKQQFWRNSDQKKSVCNTVSLQATCKYVLKMISKIVWLMVSVVNWFLIDMLKCSKGPELPSIWICNLYESATTYSDVSHKLSCICIIAGNMQYYWLFVIWWYTSLLIFIIGCWLFQV